MARRTNAARSRPAGAKPKQKGLREGVRAFKREMIVNAAIEIFYRSGYQAATVDDIAAAIAATKTVVYYHFESKEAVLAAIIERCCDTTFAAVEKGIASGTTAADKLALAAHNYAEAILGNQEMVGIYFREARAFPPSLRARVSGSERAITSMLAQAIEDGIGKGEFRPCDTQLLALTILGMISMAFYWYAEHGHISKSELCRRFSADALRLAGCEEQRSTEQSSGAEPARPRNGHRRSSTAKG